MAKTPMRIAYFSPLNPVPSGVSDYSEELLPHLAQYLELEPVVDGYTPTNVELATRFRVRDDRVYDASRYDLALYHLGNSPAHAYIYRRALREPGVIVLHDWVLHHLVAWLTLEHGDRAGYVQVMRDAYGERGAVAAEREILGLEPVNRFDFPLSERVVRTARGVIAHSHYVARAARQVAPQVPVAVIPHEMPRLEVISREAARARLQLPPEALLIGTFGHVGPAKRLPVLLEALREVRREFPQVKLVVVGSVSPNLDVCGLVELFNLHDAVIWVGKVPFDAFQVYMAAMDVCVNLRFPTAGETSGAVLRMMLQQKPVIVSRVGWFAELPDNVIAKIDLDEGERELLAATLRRLLCDADLRAALGANARRYVLEECAVEDVAGYYADFLRAVMRGNAESRVYRRRQEAVGGDAPTRILPIVGTGRRPVLRVGATDGSATRLYMSAVGSRNWRSELARAYVELGLEAEDNALREVARAIVELGLAEN